MRVYLAGILRDDASPLTALASAVTFGKMVLWQS